MNEETHRKYEIIIKLIGSTLTVLSIVIGFVTLSLEQKYQDNLTFKRQVWTKQQEIYLKTSQIVGKIANHAEDSVPESVFDQFYDLYWGELKFVEDTAVERAIYHFHTVILDYQAGNNGSQNKLKTSAVNVVEACQKSSHNTWKSLSE